MYRTWYSVRQSERNAVNTENRRSYLRNASKGVEFDRACQLTLVVQERACEVCSPQLHSSAHITCCLVYCLQVRAGQPPVRGAGLARAAAGGGPRGAAADRGAFFNYALLPCCPR